jgi:fido (protein-threonine AMPylation protein)
MSRYSDSDPYLDPETGVLVNRLGISDESTLEQIEAALVATRSYELSQTLSATGRGLFGRTERASSVP